MLRFHKKNVNKYAELKLIVQILKRSQRIKKYNSKYISMHTAVSFWPCQRNLIKTFQNEANTPLITKIALNFFWTFSVEFIRPTKLQNSDIQSNFSMSKIIQIYLKKNSLENINLGVQLFCKNCFLITSFLKIIYF